MARTTTITISNHPTAVTPTGQGLTVAGPGSGDTSPLLTSGYRLSCTAPVVDAFPAFGLASRCPPGSALSERHRLRGASFVCATGGRGLVKHDHRGPARLRETPGDRHLEMLGRRCRRREQVADAAVQLAVRPHLHQRDRGRVLRRPAEQRLSAAPTATPGIDHGHSKQPAQYAV